jgi:hypothetical protein
MRGAEFKLAGRQAIEKGLTLGMRKPLVRHVAVATASYGRDWGSVYGSGGDRDGNLELREQCTWSFLCYGDRTRNQTHRDWGDC